MLSGVSMQINGEYKMTRQQRRAEDRRSGKLAPALIERTSSRHIGKTKGLPFSRMKVTNIEPGSKGKPAVFHVKGQTTNKSQKVKATMNNIDWFIRGLTPQMKAAMLGY